MTRKIFQSHLRHSATLCTCITANLGSFGAVLQLGLHLGFAPRLSRAEPTSTRLLGSFSWAKDNSVQLLAGAWRHGSSANDNCLILNSNKNAHMNTSMRYYRVHVLTIKPGLAKGSAPLPALSWARASAPLELSSKQDFVRGPFCWFWAFRLWLRSS